MSPHVAIVTDSTAYLPQELVARNRITVVPLTVVLDGSAFAEGTEISARAVAQALRRRQHVTTSRPNPEDFAAAYRAAAEGGAAEVVSLHLSAELSGTFEAAALAAAAAPLPVRVVDTRMVAMALGYSVLAAASTVAAGGSADEAVAAAEKRASGTGVFFCVDTLEYLRRGGRIGATRAFLGTALAVKPLLHLAHGRIQALEKVRTASRAVARLEDIAVAHAGGSDVDIVVYHLDAPERAEAFARRLRDRVPALADLHLAEVGAAIGTHVGPGVLGVVVSPR